MLVVKFSTDKLIKQIGLRKNAEVVDLTGSKVIVESLTETKIMCTTEDKVLCTLCVYIRSYIRSKRNLTTTLGTFGVEKKPYNHFGSLWSSSEV